MGKKIMVVDDSVTIRAQVGAALAPSACGVDDSVKMMGLLATLNASVGLAF